MSRFTLLNRILISSCNNTSKLSINCLKVPYYLTVSKLHFKGFSLFQAPVQYPETLLTSHALQDQSKISGIYSRWKSSKQRRSAEYESGSDSDDDVEFVPGSKVLQIQTESLRCDVILKQGLGISRNKFEVLFYEGRVRVNGRRVPKKSKDVNVGDELDLIKDVSEDNPNFLNISRVEVLKARPTGDLIVLTIRKNKSLLVENYSEHPWVEPSPEDSEEK